MEAIKDYWERSTPMKFDTEKWSYLKKRTFRYDLQNYMLETFQFERWESKSVLEFGCGSGIDAVEFARCGAKVTAVDITDNAVALTEELAREVGVNVVVQKITDTRLPFSDSTFDCVYSFGVLHHIPKVEETLHELRRVLKPNGTIMAMVYNKVSLLNVYSILFLHRNEKLSEEQLASKYSERNIDCPYTKLYTKEEVSVLFEHWFRDVKVSTHYNVIDSTQERKVKLLLDDKYELGWHLVVKGMKR